MPEYHAPLREIQFVLFDVLDLEGHLATLKRADLSADVVREILSQAGHFAEHVLSPINEIGDRTPPALTANGVTVPAAFKEAFDQFKEHGWVSVAAAERWGGQAMPFAVHIPVSELWCSSAMAWRSATGLTEGALLALERHASRALQSRYAPRLATGEWTGTMCLTEPQAGSDLALLRTKAVAVGEDLYEISGTKIYISFGEHDLTTNIVHLVLARLPDAPEGVKGISLFVVPRFREDGRANGVKAIGLEHKMGIHGSPTCVMEFDRAQGHLVGHPGDGLSVMFTMMNQARLGVGLQGLGLMERALQQSRRYAFDRIQGRALSAKSGHERIVHHPDVRRMLMIQKSLTEAARLLIYDTYRLLDVAEGTTGADAQRCERIVAVLVPIMKAMLTEWGMECTSLAIQVHGGAGYIRSTGVEQWFRDARITPIYE